MRFNTGLQKVGNSVNAVLGIFLTLWKFGSQNHDKKIDLLIYYYGFNKEKLYIVSLSPVNYKLNYSRKYLQLVAILVPLFFRKMLFHEMLFREVSVGMFEYF